MNDTGKPPNGASPLFTEAEWRALAKVEKDRWLAFRRAHPSSEWRPFCRAIIECGYRLPPTEGEVEYLWPIVDARPNDAAAWFREAAKPQGLLRMQPSWAVALRGVSVRWFELTGSIPEDEDDWRYAREGEAEARETLKRIGWYRDP